MPRLTLITPLAAGRDEFFSATAESVAAAHVPHGWDVAWRIQVDGVAYEATVWRTRKVTKGMANVRIGWHGYQAGAARARSFALFADDRPPQDWILTLDGDDVLLPDTLRLVTSAIDARPFIHWVAGGVLRPTSASSDWPVLNPNRWDGDPPSGFAEVPEDDWSLLSPLIPHGAIAPREVLDYMAASGRFPIFATCVAYPALTVWRAGGWPGTPTGEDAALLARISDEHHGIALEAPFIAYRQHAKQNTRSDWYAPNREVTWRMIRATRPPAR